MSRWVSVKDPTYIFEKQIKMYGGPIGTSVRILY